MHDPTPHAGPEVGLRALDSPCTPHHLTTHLPSTNTQENVMRTKMVAKLLGLGTVVTALVAVLEAASKWN